MSEPRPQNHAPRRRAAAPRRYRGSPSSLVALAVVAATALAVAVAPATPPPTAPPGAAAADAGALVDRTVLGCPASQNGSLRGRFSAGLAPLDELGDGGKVEVDGESVEIGRGSVETVKPSGDGGAPAPVIDAEGEAAAGLFGARADRTADGAAAGQCVAPRAGWYFVGAGGSLDHASELWLANLDPGPAVVDLRLYDENGPVDTVATRGVTIAPGEATRFSLADLAPQSEELMVSVRATRGRVAATMADRFAARPGGRQGLEWLAGSDRPRRNLRLAGVPAKASARTLLVANPSELEALVDVRVAGSGGSFAPAGLGTVSVAPGTVEAVDVGDALSTKEPVALRLRSRVPVVAGVRSLQGSDTSYAEPVDDVVGAAAAVTVPGTKSTVQLSAGRDRAVARVTAYDDQGERAAADQVRIDAQATTAWTPPRGTAYVVVEPVSGRVHGATTYAGPAGVAAVPLWSLPWRLQIPAVVPGP